jgi:uridine monophosphate synthetase
VNVSFFENLTKRAQQIDSLLCVGLDPHPELLPAFTAQAVRDFCTQLIQACAPYACAFKPNIAFFEVLGPEGMAVLKDVIASVPDGIPVILDAKRGDIASTARAYAQAVFETMEADAVTASPYLGRDSLQPFLDRPEKGVFVLCKTSNPGADEFQALDTGNGDPLYIQVARQAQTWSDYDNVGLVVGATDPAALASVRAAAPDLWLLTPGIGAQGGNLKAALSAGLRKDKLGVLVTASRSIARADDPGQAAAELRDAINQARKSSSTPTRRVALDRLATALLESECVRFGRFTLKSGKQSSIYLDLRRLASHPQALKIVAESFIPLLRQLDYDRMAAIPYGALPIGVAISLAGNWPLIYPRQEVKTYGTRSKVEGVYNQGDRVVVIDDLVTTGESKFEAIEKLVTSGLQVRDVVVLIDRQQGAVKVMEKAGYQLLSVATLTELLEVWREQGAISPEQYNEVMADIGG